MQHFRLPQIMCGVLTVVATPVAAQETGQKRKRAQEEAAGEVCRVLADERLKLPLPHGVRNLHELHWADTPQQI
jgi:hypothetical protein